MSRTESSYKLRKKNERARPRQYSFRASSDTKLNFYTGPKDFVMYRHPNYAKWLEFLKISKHVKLMAIKYWWLIINGTFYLKLKSKILSINIYFENVLCFFSPVPLYTSFYFAYHNHMLVAHHSKIYSHSSSFIWSSDKLGRISVRVRSSYFNCTFEMRNIITELTFGCI